MKRTAKSMMYGLVASVFAFAAGAVIAEDAVEYVTCVNIGYTSGPCLPSGWSDGLAPSQEKQYLVLNTRNADNKEYVLSTGNNSGTAFTFEGGLITVGNQSTNGKIIFCGCGTTTFPNGLKIYKAHGSNVNFGNSNNQNTYTHHIGGPITLDSAYHSAPQFTSAFRSNGQHLHFDGALIGDDKTGMQFYGNEWSNNNTNDIVAFSGNLTKYYGYIDIKGSSKVKVPDVQPEQICTNTLILALGSVECPGTVKLTDGQYAFLRTIDTDDTAKIAKLVMPDGATIFPQVDIVNKKCGVIEVTGEFTRSGKQCIRAKFLNPFNSCDHGRLSLPVLKVAETAGTLNADDFELAYEDVGEMPEGALSLKVANDDNGVSTLYLEIAAFSLDGVTDVELTESDALKESAFLEDFADHWTPIGVPQDGRTYHVKNGRMLRTPYLAAAGESNTAPYGDDQIFSGDAIVLGDATSVGTLGLWSMARVRIPSLVLSNAVVSSAGNWGGKRSTIVNSDILVAATAPEKAVFRTDSTWQHLFLEGSLSGDVNSSVRFLFTNANSDMNLDSDCSAYNGLVEVSATSDGGTNLADFRIGAAKLPGTLKLGAVTGKTGGTVKLTATNGLEVGTLVVNRPTTLSINVASATYEADRDIIKILDSLEMNSTVTVDVAFTGGEPVMNNLDAAFIPVMRWPVSCEVDESKFAAGTVTVSGVSANNQLTPSSGFMTAAFRTEGEWRIMGLEKREVVYLLVPDDSKTNDNPVVYSARTSFDECYKQEGDRAYGWNWSDGQRPSPEFDYYVDKTLRTNSSEQDQVFRGHAMHLTKGTLVMQSYSATITNLNITGGNVMHIHQGGDTRAYGFARGGTRRIYGNAFVSQMGASIVSPFLTTTSGSGCFDFAMKLSGSGQVNFKMNSSTLFPQNAVNPSYLMISGDNSKWTGNLLCCATDGKLWSSDEHLVVLFSNMDNLGGDLSKFVYNGLTLRHAATLKPMESTVYSRVNRGIFIEGFGGVDCDTNIVFNIDSTITYSGKLRKQGAGALLFGGTSKFLQADKTAGDQPIAGAESNVLHVEEGSVGVTASDACDGVKMVFEEGASLRVKVSEESTALGAKGLVNLKAETPFAINAPSGKLAVEFDTEALEADGTVYRVAICTVKSDKASSIRGKFALKRPQMGGYSAVMADEIEDSAAGTVTFVAELRYCAMRVIIR